MILATDDAIAERCFAALKFPPTPLNKGFFVFNPHRPSPERGTPVWNDDDWVLEPAPPQSCHTKPGQQAAADVLWDSRTLSCSLRFQILLGSFSILFPGSLDVYKFFSAEHHRRLLCLYCRTSTVVIFFFFYLRRPSRQSVYEMAQKR